MRSLRGVEIPIVLACDGHDAMRRDIRMLEEGRLAAWLYTWKGPWVSLGLSQSESRDLRPGHRVPVTRRPTGGRAVLHGHDLTLGLVCPLSNLARIGEDSYGLSRSIRAVYRRIIEPIRLALVDSGLPADLGENTRFAKSSGRSADCFATASPNDLVCSDTGQKICGVALKLTERAVLVQASIPVGPPLVDPASLFVRPAPVAWIDLDFGQFCRALGHQLGMTLA